MATAAAIDRLVHHSVILEFADVVTFRNPDRDNNTIGRDNNTGAVSAPSPEEPKNARNSRSNRPKTKR